MHNHLLTRPACLVCALAGVVVLVTSATAQSARPAIPALRVMEHQQLTCGTQVIYDTQVNMAEEALQVRLVWQLGELGAYAGLNVVGQVNAQQQDHLADQPYRAITVSSVVKALRPDGRAAVAVVYTLQKGDASPASCAFVDAVIDVGHPVHLTGSDGLPVTLTLLLPSPTAPPRVGPSDDNG
ncbi:hypothetical protein FHW69_002809 [Luteibacter sp. Sphag1AF]|uniref:hypothetical protein n=1 Tax=Luteibacter sp. Sphag1AF TaxID=2587031 RepID=UPI0016081884|nr:hypothetical protein [Luteibacter sp. Sphag1AF]MBB3228174.1 hypothetical protein [Luteibacter sp. Sphag1AF]